MYNSASDYANRQLTQRANDLFEQAWRLGQIKRIVALFTGQSRQLPLLSDLIDQYKDVPMCELGVQPIRLEQITGTQGKISFDRDFLPIQRRSKNRWISAAIAMLTDPTSLPPIDVVQVGDAYYVGDGNHRVSVAKALGNMYIDGEVTQWVIAAD
jgi:hypothetical protein